MRHQDKLVLDVIGWYDGTGLPAVYPLPSKVFIVFETVEDDGIDGVV